MPRINFSWATNVNHPAGSDPWSGQPNKVAPPLGQQETGFLPKEKPSAEKLNFMFHEITEGVKLIVRNNAFVGDVRYPVEISAYASDFGFLSELDDLTALTARPYYALVGANIQTSDDGINYGSGAAHGVTGPTSMAVGKTRGVFAGSGQTIVVGSTGVGKINNGATLTGAGHTETFNDVCAHYRTVSGQVEFIGFVAVGINGRINVWLSATGGGAWTSALSLGASRDYRYIVSRNGVLIAGYDLGVSVSYNDGANWTHHTFTDLQGSRFYSVEWCEEAGEAGVWVAQGWNDTTLIGYTYVSVDDGLNWTDESANVRRYHRSGLEQSIGGMESNIATDGSRFYLPGMWSEDGIRWFVDGSGEPDRVSSLLPPMGIGGGHVCFGFISGPKHFRTAAVRTSVSPLMT